MIIRTILSVFLLVSFCAAQFVYNPSVYPREQVIVFGTPKGSSFEVLKSLPTVDIVTARVYAPAWHNGKATLQGKPPRPDLGFTYYRTLKWKVANANEFVEMTNVKSFNNSQMMVTHKKAKAGNLVYHLFVYQGFGEDWCRYEFVAAIESLHLKFADIRMKLVVEGGNHVDRINKEGFVGTLHDRAGVCSYGSVYASPRGDDPLLTYVTKLAIRDWELTACGEFIKWGPWDTLPGGALNHRRVNKGFTEHRGVILEKNPGQTGEQFGFGVWKHFDAIRPGQIHRLAHDRAAVLQEALRSMWLFEPNGDLAIVEKHPRFVSWAETWHWHPNIGVDKFGRDYEDPGNYHPWGTMDQEHYSAVALSEDVLLRGSFLSQFILKMKIFHFIKEIGYPASGRALGRYMFASRDLYIATGDKRIIQQLKERWLPAFKRSWTFTNGHMPVAADLAKADPIVGRLIGDDPHTKIPGLEWVVWEDGIAVQGLDVLWPMLNDPEVKLATFLLARSIVNHGFAENGRIYKAIKWNGARKPLGPQLATSVQTNYSEWAIPALAICIRLGTEFGDTATVQKAIKLLKPMITGGYGNLDSYLGPLGAFDRR